MIAVFNNLSFRGKTALMAFGIIAPIMLTGTACFTGRGYQLTVTTDVGGLMNFVDAKSQGVIRVLGQNEKPARKLALLTEGGNSR